MVPEIDQIWEWDVDREHINVFVVRRIVATEHKAEVLCEIIEGPESGKWFETDMSSFNNCNWRILHKK